MKNFHPFLEHCVTRLNIIFNDDLGNQKPINATGFWLKGTNKEPMLVTNRHNLDPHLKDSKYVNYKISKISVQIREKRNGSYTDD